MKKILLYVLSFILGFVSAVAFFVSTNYLITVDLFNILSKFFGQGYDKFILIFLIAVSFIIPILIFFLITWFLWKFNSNLKNKYSFSFIAKLNGAFILGNIIFYIIGLFGFRGL